MSGPTSGVSALVQAVQVDKHYVDGPSVVRVLTGLDLTIAPGETVAVVGESVVGKSTLLHLLGALDTPSGGRVLFAGEDVFARPATQVAAFRNREIGFVFQFHHLLGDFTALENVMLPALIAREPFGSARAQATALLARVGLADRMTHRPGQLSGGEQQRVAVARALVRRPRLVLADEPTGNLDRITGESVQKVLLDLNREHGSALVVATHSERLAAAMQRTLRLTGGRLVPIEVEADVAGVHWGGAAGGGAT